MRKKTSDLSGLFCRCVAVMAIFVLNLPAYADTRNNVHAAPAAPAAHAAPAMHPGGAFGNAAGAHPAGLAGHPAVAAGAHLPGNMGHGPAPANASAAHVPSSVGGGHATAAHVPSTVHTPAAAGAGTHTPAHVAATHTPAGPAANHATPGAVHTQEQVHQGGAQPQNAVHVNESQKAGMPADARPVSPAVAAHQQYQVSQMQAHRNMAQEHQFASTHEHDFHSRNVREFDAHERAVWRNGRWHNDWHYGRYGWWWNVGGVWYEYDNPVFPYPLTVAPLVVHEDVVVSSPLPAYYVNGSGVVSTASGAELASGKYGNGSNLVVVGRESAIPRLPAVAVGSFHCDSPVSDFPVAGSCPTGWVFVPLPAGQASY